MSELASGKTVSLSRIVRWLNRLCDTPHAPEGPDYASGFVLRTLVQAPGMEAAVTATAARTGVDSQTAIAAIAALHKLVEQGGKLIHDMVVKLRASTGPLQESITALAAADDEEVTSTIQSLIDAVMSTDADAAGIDLSSIFVSSQDNEYDAAALVAALVSSEYAVVQAVFRLTELCSNWVLGLVTLAVMRKQIAAAKIAGHSHAFTLAQLKAIHGPLLEMAGSLLCAAEALENPSSSSYIKLATYCEKVSEKFKTSITVSELSSICDHLGRGDRGRGRAISEALHWLFQQITRDRVCAMAAWLLTKSVAAHGQGSAEVLHGLNVCEAVMRQCTHPQAVSPLGFFMAGASYGTMNYKLTPIPDEIYQLLIKRFTQPGFADIAGDFPRWQMLSKSLKLMTVSHLMV